jgi:toxin ParE1/3/4
MVCCARATLAQISLEFHNCGMTEKEIVLETIRALPDNCSLAEIAERIEFMAGVQKGLDQLGRHSSRGSQKTVSLMAYKLIWSPAARDDLYAIVVFIARDNPERAMSFGYQLISETDRLHDFPESGRIVPEYENERLREIIFRPYRIVYRVNHDQKICEIARVWHSARRVPPI